MATDLELDRLAGVLHIMQPRWHAAETRSWLRSEPARVLRARPIRDLAVVMLACALDERDNRTPAAVLRPGPWWDVVQRVNDRAEGYLPGPDGQPCGRPGHEHERAGVCRLCRAEDLAGGIDPGPRVPVVPNPAPPGWRERTAEALEARRILSRLDLDIAAAARGGTVPSSAFTLRASAVTLALIANGLALEGEPRLDVDDVRAFEAEHGPSLVLHRPCRIDDDVPDRVVEIDTPSSPDREDTPDV